MGKAQSIYVLPMKENPIGLVFQVKSSYWNRDKQKVRHSRPRYEVLNEQLFKIHSKAEDAIIELNDANRLNSKRVIEILKGYDRKAFYTFTTKYIEDQLAKGSVRIVKNTKVLVNKIREFTISNSFLISDIDREFIDRFGTQLKTKKKTTSI